MKTQREQVGARLVQLRGEESQVAFARRMNVHRNSLGRYEAGDAEVGADLLAALFAHGYNPNWVLTGEGEPRSPESDGLLLGEGGSLRIGARLKLIRGEASQEEFAAEIGVVKGTVWRYERGDRMPDAAFLLRLFELGFNPTWLLTGQGSPRLGEATPPAFDGASIYAANLATLCTTKCSGIAAQISVLIEHLDRPSRTVLKHLITSMNLLTLAGKELEADAQANTKGTH